MEPITVLIWVVFIGVGVYSYFQRKEEEEGYKEKYEVERKEHLKELYENISEREDLSLFDKKAFWTTIDRCREQGKGEYKNITGLLKDKWNHLSPKELIQLDNLWGHLVKEAFNWELYGASSIMFKNQALENLVFLTSLLVTRGEIVFNNAVVNPNIIINQDFGEVNTVVIGDIIGELYFKKTNELMPEISDSKYDLIGDEWKQKDLPSRFPQIWDRFA